jgi:glycerol-3-phosphate dehydrogenase
MGEHAVSGTFDVAVIGAGVVGCAIARKLAATQASVVLLDARVDIGDGTSKANTAILHTGFDSVPGSLESRLVTGGYRLLTEYAGQAGIALERTGAVLVAWDEEQFAALPKLMAKAGLNGYASSAMLEPADVYGMVPGLGAGVRGGLHIPDEAIIDPWSTTLALANDAIGRGVELRLETRVTAVDLAAGRTQLSTPRGPVSARWVVNAAGLGSDVIDGMFGHHRFTVTPRRGELIVFDKQARPLTPCIVLSVPTSRSKGVLVSPTIFGNVMLGPTAEDLEDRSDTSTSHDGLERLMREGRRIVPALVDEEVTATYAGLRAATEHSDYVIDVDSSSRYAVVGGIRSTGLTASLAIADYVHDELAAAGFEYPERQDLPATATVPNLGEAFLRPYQQDDLIRSDPAYGEVVCFCERVTRGEIRDAFNSPLPPRDLDGLRRRTRALMGRCQGFFCGAAVECLMRDGAGE